MPTIGVKNEYELYQIITDFHDSLEIFREAIQNALDENATEIWCTVRGEREVSGTDIVIEIINNGTGLERERANHFFDLANSTKVDSKLMPIPGKIGFKGHGSKIFFNSKKVEIVSKTSTDYWASSVDDPLGQLAKSGKIDYATPANHVGSGFSLANSWNQGFGVRIISHKHFNNQFTLHKLNHENLRDYIKWYTVMGSVLSLDKTRTYPILYLHGIDIDSFQQKYSNGQIDPVPVFRPNNNHLYETITFGHFFPEERKTESSMKAYAKRIGSNKAYYDFYSRKLCDQVLSCKSGTKFKLVINLEGYETKRRYDPLLLGRGKTRTSISHTDSDRYGLWACKGGVPVEKIDSWIEVGKGGYTFMHGFLDCDEFSLTANRGSINNTPTEIIDNIKRELTELFSQKHYQDAINERSELEKFENQLQSIDDDFRCLKKRYNAKQQRNRIVIPGFDELVLFEPSRTTTGYSESETLVLLVQLMTAFPKLFTFSLIDYNTQKGIDFVVEHQESGKYIELKGTLHKSINHPFRHIYKFICYEIGVTSADTLEDIEDFKMQLKNYKEDKFESYDDRYMNIPYQSHSLIPCSTSSISSIQVIELKSILTDILGAHI